MKRFNYRACIVLVVFCLLAANLGSVCFSLEGSEGSLADSGSSSGVSSEQAAECSKVDSIPQGGIEGASKPEMNGNTQSAPGSQPELIASEPENGFIPQSSVSHSVVMQSPELSPDGTQGFLDWLDADCPGDYTLTGNVLLTETRYAQVNHPVTLETGTYTVTVSGNNLTLAENIRVIGTGVPFCVQDGGYLDLEGIDVITTGETAIQVRENSGLLVSFGSAEDPFSDLTEISAAGPAIDAAAGSNVMVQYTKLRGAPAIRSEGTVELIYCDVQGNTEVTGAFHLIACDAPDAQIPSEHVWLEDAVGEPFALSPAGISFTEFKEGYVTQNMQNFYVDRENGDMGLSLTFPVEWDESGYRPDASPGTEYTIHGRCVAPENLLGRLVALGFIEGLEEKGAISLPVRVAEEQPIPLEVSMEMRMGWQLIFPSHIQLERPGVFARVSFDEGKSWIDYEFDPGEDINSGWDCELAPFFEDAEGNLIKWDPEASYLFRMQLEGSVYDGMSKVVKWPLQDEPPPIGSESGDGSISGNRGGGGQGETDRRLPTTQKDPAAAVVISTPQENDVEQPPAGALVSEPTAETEPAAPVSLEGGDEEESEQPDVQPVQAAERPEAMEETSNSMSRGVVYAAAGLVCLGVCAALVAVMKRSKRKP